jgi:hypothetical protein
LSQGLGADSAAWFSEGSGGLVREMVRESLDVFSIHSEISLAAMQLVDGARCDLVEVAEAEEAPY